MNITDFLKRPLVVANLRSTTKVDVLAELSCEISKVYSTVSYDMTVRTLLEREKLGSTGIQNGIAIPHGKIKGLQNIIIALGRSIKGIDFQAQDNKPSHIFFVLLAPEDAAGTHLKVLARLSKILNDASFRKSVMEAADASDIYQLITNADKVF